MPQSIFHIIFGLLIIGLILFFVAPYIPGQIMTMIFVVLGVGLILWLARAAGLIGGPPVV